MQSCLHHCQFNFINIAHGEYTFFALKLSIITIQPRFINKQDIEDIYIDFFPNRRNENSDFTFIIFVHKGAHDEDSKEERKNVDTVLVLPSIERDQMMAATFDFPSLSFEDSDEGSNWNWNTLLRPNFLDGWYQTLQSKG